MTIDERFERIEHVTAGMAEQWRQEREENRQLWRDTQRQIDQLAAESRAADERLGKRLEQLAADSRAADERLEKRLERFAQEARAADKRLGERIDALVIAIGEFVARQKQQ